MIESKVAFTILALSPIADASAFARSASMPTTVLPSRGDELIRRVRRVRRDGERALLLVGRGNLRRDRPNDPGAGSGCLRHNRRCRRNKERERTQRPRQSDLTHLVTSSDYRGYAITVAAATELPPPLPPERKPEQEGCQRRYGDYERAPHSARGEADVRVGRRDAGRRIGPGERERHQAQPGNGGGCENRNAARDADRDERADHEDDLGRPVRRPPRAAEDQAERVKERRRPRSRGSSGS